MNLNQALQNLDTVVKTVYKTTKKEYKDPLAGILYDVTPVKGAVNNIVTLNSVPGMREFKSERKHGVADNTVHTIAPRKWESTLDVEREKIEDDDLGQIPNQTRVMTTKSGRHYGALAVAALPVGFTANLSDGKPFFHADRGNLVPGAFSASTFSKAFDALVGMKDADGDFINPIPTHLIVGQENREEAEKILLREKLDNGQSNTNYKRVELIVDPRITGKATFLVAAKEGMCPLTIAERVKVSEPVAKTDLNGDKAFETDVFSWGLRGRYDAAYQAAQFIVGLKGV